MTGERDARSSEADRAALVETLLAAAEDADLGLFVAVDDPETSLPRGVYTSQSAARMLGYEPEEYLDVPIMSLFVPEELPKMEERLRRVKAGEPVPNTFETEVFRKDGRRMPIEVTVTRVKYRGLPARVSFMRDITERRRAEATLVQTDRLATLGTLAAGVAHEINNPLAYVLLNIGFVERHLVSWIRDPEEATRIRAMLTAAREGTERVATIVRDLRSVSRDDAETPRLVDVRSVIRSALNIAANEIRARAKIVTHFDEVPAVYGSEGRLGQVVLNLLLNAAHAIPEHEHDSHEVRVEARAIANDRVSVLVADTGCGIPAEIRPRIFDPFFTTKPPGVGTGLGLAICQSIVTDLSGTIDVDSREGSGTRVTVTLPACPGVVLERDTATERSRTTASAGRRLRVLVADDEPAIAHALADGLGVDHDVVAVTSGEAALARALAEPFDAYVFDVVMHDLDGQRLYEELRRRVPGIERRIVLATGATAIPWVEAFLARIPNARVAKPFDIDTLRAILASLAQS